MIERILNEVEGIDIVMVASNDFGLFAGDRDGSPSYNAREELVREAVLAHGKILAGPSSWQNRPGYMMFQGPKSAKSTGYEAQGFRGRNVINSFSFGSVGRIARVINFGRGTSSRPRGPREAFHDAAKFVRRDPISNARLPANPPRPASDSGCPDGHETASRGALPCAGTGLRHRRKLAVDGLVFAGQ